MSFFSKVKVRKPKRSTFNLSHNAKLTFPFGLLIPTYWNYFEPNTKFRASSIIQCRTMPLLAPIMHEVNIYSYWWQIPIRQLMEEKDYEAFITGGIDGTAEINYPKYQVRLEDLDNGSSLLDYMGVPVRQADQENLYENGFVFDAMPFRAYAKVWNEYFRDQNTTPELEFSKFTGLRMSDSIAGTTIEGYSEPMESSDYDLLSLKSRCWTKDYFTSALPWAQRGGNVDMPFTAITDLAMEGTAPSGIAASDGQKYSGYLKSAMNNAGDRVIIDPVDTDPSLQGRDAQIDITPHTKATTRVLGTINDLRNAIALQRWKERNALGGARYIEQINSHFGVWADDYRLQRPLYLGGSRSPLQISEVLQTSESTDTSVQGTMSGRGYTLDNQGNVNCFVKEHSIIMNMICVIPKASYFQGMPRKLDIRDKFDFPWPLLAHLGEQEVRNKEIFYTGNKDVDDAPFGYQSRYSQYKYEPNRTHGDFNSSLKFWTLSREFMELPTLSREFLSVGEEKDGLDRIFPVLSGDNQYKYVGHHFWAQINFNIKVKRPLPYFGTPNL